MKVIIFSVRGTLYAAPLDLVEAIRPPVPVSPLPFAPPAIVGLVGVGGQVLALLDLGLRLQAAPVAAAGPVGSGPVISDSTESDPAQVPSAGELLVIRAATGRLAVWVDHAVTILDLDDSTLHGLGRTRTGGSDSAGAGPAASADSTDSAAPDAVGGAPVVAPVVAGEFTWDGHTVILLDAATLGLDTDGSAADDADAAGGAGEARRGLGGHTDPGDETGPQDTKGSGGDELACLVVEAGGERYGFDISVVTEVYGETGTTPLPKAPAEICGLSVLRGHPRLVLSLARLLGRPSQEDGTARVMVTIHDVDLVFRVGSIIGLRRFSDRNHQPVTRGQGELASYLIDEDGLVTARLALDRLITEDRLASYRSFLPARAAEAGGRGHVQTRRLMTFWVGEELCGLDADRIERLCPYTTPIALPDANCLVGGLAGVVDIGGRVLPVADLRTLLTAFRPRPPPEALIVVRGREGNLALAADSLHRLLDLPVTAIRPAGVSSHRLVAEIGRDEDHLVSILDLDGLDPTGGPLGGSMGGGPLGAPPAGPTSPTGPTGRRPTALTAGPASRHLHGEAVA